MFTEKFLQVFCIFENFHNKILGTKKSIFHLYYHLTFSSVSRESQLNFDLARKIWSILRIKAWGWVALIKHLISSSQERLRSLITVVSKASRGLTFGYSNLFSWRGLVSSAE